MVEIDDEVAAVWESVVGGAAEWLARRIVEFELNRETLAAELSRKVVSTREKDFQTILKNRTFHGGILARGAGFIKRGENGKGIRSRWYPKTLARRFMDLDHVAGKIDFRKDDGISVMRQYAKDPSVVFFIDPPYTAGGKKADKRLYHHCDLDHQRLFATCKTIAGDFLMTYDHSEEVKAIARAHDFQMRLIPMTNTHHATMEELVIGRDLSWMDKYPQVREPEVDYKIT